MNLLIDTHVLLWWFADDVTHLGAEARNAIEDATAVFVSSASVWEIEIKRALGKLDAPEDVAYAISASGMRPVEMSIEHAVRAGRLPAHHNDPFDRMIVAQAQAESLTLVTHDKRLTAYDVELLTV
jgi:PIN domain nuclease of toxin-antitoxin system